MAVRYRKREQVVVVALKHTLVHNSRMRMRHAVKNWRIKSYEKDAILSVFRGKTRFWLASRTSRCRIIYYCSVPCPDLDNCRLHSEVDSNIFVKSFTRRQDRKKLPRSRSRWLRSCCCGQNSGEMNSLWEGKEQRHARENEMVNSAEASNRTTRHGAKVFDGVSTCS